MNGRFQILYPRSGLYREAPFSGLCIFLIDRPDDALILCSSLYKAFILLATIRGLFSLTPVRIAICGCRFADRPKKAFGLTLEVRFEEMGSDEHVDSAIDSAVFQWYFPVGLALSTVLSFAAMQSGFADLARLPNHAGLQVIERKRLWPSRMILTPIQVL